MPKRSKIRPQKSRKMFRRHADKMHKRNLPPPRKMPMRGGIRL